jgi:outer membrane protein assembly factor BamB
MKPSWSTWVRNQVSATPAVAGGLVVVPMDNEVAAFDLATGKEKWRTELRGPSKDNRQERWSPSPVVAGDVLYAAVFRGRVARMDLKTGKAAWTWDDPRGRQIAATPTLAGDKLLIGSLAGDVTCLEAATGKALWCVAGQHGDWVYGAPAVHERSVFVARGRARLTCLDLDTGKAKWEAKLPDNTKGTPVYHDGRILLGLEGIGVPGLVCLSAQDGKTLWNTGRTSSIPAAPVVSGDLVYAGNHSGDVSAHSIATGEVKWLNAEGSLPTSGSPAVTAKHVVVADCTKRVRVLDKTSGKTLAVFTSDESFTGGPVLADGRIIAVSRTTLHPIEWKGLK